MLTGRTEQIVRGALQTPLECLHSFQTDIHERMLYAADVACVHPGGSSPATWLGAKSFPLAGAHPPQDDRGELCQLLLGVTPLGAKSIQIDRQPP